MSPEDVTMSPTTEAEPAEQTAQDRLFLALLTSQTPMPNGGWYGLIDEAAAPLQATVARLREALDDAGRTFRRITGSPETDLVLYARDVAQWADDATNDVDAALSDSPDKYARQKWTPEAAALSSDANEERQP
jgi:hypothetical protein